MMVMKNPHRGNVDGHEEHDDHEDQAEEEEEDGVMCHAIVLKYTMMCVNTDIDSNYDDSDDNCNQANLSQV